MPVFQKAKDYLDLANVLVTRFASDSGGRAAEFLIGICNSSREPPAPLHEIRFFLEGGTVEEIHVGRPPLVMGKVAPLVKFQAVLR